MDHGLRLLLSLSVWLASCHLVFPFEAEEQGGDGGPPLGHDAIVLDGFRPVDGASATGWILVPAGTFIMGSPESEPCRMSKQQETQHLVTLTRSFEIARTEVTQPEFLSMLGYNPARFTGCLGCPVEQVSWHEAAAYCNALSSLAGLPRCYLCTGSDALVTCIEQVAFRDGKIYDCSGYRLATEAEWEYAYRAGTSTTYFNGDNDLAACDDCSAGDSNAAAIGWHCGNAGGTPHHVRRRMPNLLGIFDMAGNVMEWVNDWTKGDLGSAAVTDPWGNAAGPHRQVRGGSWYQAPKFMRAAARFGLLPHETRDYLGLRCARTVK
jgi:formylglycine-generating enzyme required for sulfatase activity